MKVRKVQVLDLSQLERLLASLLGCVINLDMLLLGTFRCRYSFTVNIKLCVAVNLKKHLFVSSLNIGNSFHIEYILKKELGR